MLDSKWRIRVMYYLPANATISEIGPYGSTVTAYLELIGLSQDTAEIQGYTEFQAAGFWRSPQKRRYLSAVRVIAVGYEESDEDALNGHIERMKQLIHQVYAAHGCPQLVIYVLSQDIMEH